MLRWLFRNIGICMVRLYARLFDCLQLEIVNLSHSAPHHAHEFQFVFGFHEDQFLVGFHVG
jgi:hypothetical protein